MIKLLVQYSRAVYNQGTCTCVYVLVLFSRCLRGYQQRVSCEDSESLASPTPGAPQSLITTGNTSSVSTEEDVAQAVVVGYSSATSDTGTKKSITGQVNGYDFTVTVKAELEAHSARHLAQLPLVGLRRRERKLRLLELCQQRLWPISSNKEATIPSEMDDGPNEEEETLIAENQAQMSTQNATSFADVKISMTTPRQEQVDNDGACRYSDGLTGSPSQTALGEQAKGGVVCTTPAPLLGLEGSPGQRVYELSFHATGVMKLAWYAATNHLHQLHRSLVGVKDHRLFTNLIYSHHLHLPAQLQQCDTDCAAAFLSQAVTSLLSPLHEPLYLPGGGVVTESRLLLGFFKAMHKFSHAYDKVLDQVIHNHQEGSDSGKGVPSTTPDAVLPTPIESQVGVGLECPGDSQRSNGCDDGGVSSPAASELKGSGVLGWELLAEEPGHRVYRKPYLNTGLFQYKGE